MRRVLFLLRKEFAQVFRDRVLVFQLLAPPFIQILVITSAATFEVRDMELHLVDRDRTPASRELERAFAGSARFTVARSSSSSEAAREDLVRGRADGVVEVPEGFARELGRGRSPVVRLTFDGSKGAVAGTAAGYANAIVAGFDPDGAASEPRAALAAGPRLDVRTRLRYNPDLDYDDYMALGVLVIMITIVGTVMTALNIAREREQGTIEQLNVSPITKGQFVAGKLAPFWILGLFEVALGLLLAKIVFDVPFVGSLWIVFLATAVYLVTALGVGLLISTASETQQQAQFLAFFLLMFYLFLSGIFTPVQSMPEWARWLAEANPMKHFLVLVRGVLLKGAGPGAVLRELLFLGGFAVLTLPAAIRVYSKTAS